MTRPLGWKGHAWLGLTARLYLGGLFVWACLHKIRDPHSFAVDIATYQILPLGLVNVLAIVLPWVELAAGLMLILGFRVRAGTLLVSAMMVMFTAAISIALARGLELSCGCFASQGAAEDPISFRTVLRDSSWLLLCAYILVFDRRPVGLESWIERRGRPPRPMRPVGTGST